MLLSITSKCSMSCPHCLDDARVDSNEFMDEQTFIDAVKWNFKHDNSLLITGGEPMEHHKFWEFMNIVKEEMPTANVMKEVKVYVITNGMYLDKDRGELEDRINALNDTKGKNIRFQITSVKGLYPIQINTHARIFRNKNIDFFDRIEPIYPQGRALINMPEKYDCNIYTCPKCFNIRSSIKFSNNDFKHTINMLRKMKKYCSPRINYDGSIKLGESRLCPSVASIYDSDEEIEKKIKAFKCQGCKMILDRMDSTLKLIIGED